jgi:glycosyltransferase involved in cell wall biosynthesis
MATNNVDRTRLGARLCYRLASTSQRQGTIGHPPQMNPRVAVLIPCYNEAATIAKVVQDFRTALPSAVIYVYDNNSTDPTAESARAAGAFVYQATIKGKGHVVRRMFRDIDADFYLMVDGDDTYDAAVAAQMIKLARCGNDLVNCIREDAEDAAYRGGHRWGNAMLTGVVRTIFGNRAQDMLSGYKVFSRRFVKSLPILSQGFDIETELTIHALELAMPVAHVHGRYKRRPVGSASKLRTYRDGWRILMMIFRLVRHERPLLFFGVIAGLLAMVSMLISIPLALTYLRTGLVPRLPTAVLSTGIMLLAALSLFAGIILDTVSRGRREVRLLAYLQQRRFDANGSVSFGPK